MATTFNNKDLWQKKNNSSETYVSTWYRNDKNYPCLHVYTIKGTGPYYIQNIIKCIISMYVVNGRNAVAVHS